MERYSNLPVVCILTSASCGHCNAMRATGDFIKSESATASIPGGYAWTETFFRRLLFGGIPLKEIGTSANPSPVLRCYEIHFGPMGFPPTEMFSKIVEFNEFAWDPSPKVATRQKFRAEYVKTDEAVSDENPAGNLRVVSTINGVTTTSKKAFGDFLALNIPTQIYNYVRVYPSWFITTANSWNRALMSNIATNPFSPLIGNVSGLKTVLRGISGTKAIYGVENPSGVKMEDVLVTCSKLAKGQIEFLVPKPSDTAAESAVPASRSSETTGIVPIAPLIPLPVPETVSKGDDEHPKSPNIRQAKKKTEESYDESTETCRHLGYRIVGNV